MHIDFDYFSSVLASVARDISADQIIVEGMLLKPSQPSKLKRIILRNKLNTEILAQLVYIAQNQSDSQIQPISLLSAIESSINGFDLKNQKFELDRSKPLIDILADKGIVVSVLRIIFCLLKLENPALKTISIGFRRRGSYVSMRISADKQENTVSYLDDVTELINAIFTSYGAKMEWRMQEQKRAVFLRLHLAKQIPLGYNN
jgi:hypothetical protein